MRSSGRSNRSSASIVAITPDTFVRGRRLPGVNIRPHPEKGGPLGSPRRGEKRGAPPYPGTLCPIFFFSALGFPDLETGSCRWGSSNSSDPLYHFFFLPRLSGFVQVGFFQLWGGFFLRGVLPTVGFFFLLSAFRIWKQGRAGGGLLPRLSGFGNRLHAGGGCRYTQGGCRSTKLRHRHCPKSTVSSIILVPRRRLTLIFFPSLGFPDLETGSCRWGSSNCGVFFPSVGFCQLWDFFS